MYFQQGCFWASGFRLYRVSVMGLKGVRGVRGLWCRVWRFAVLDRKQDRARHRTTPHEVARRVIERAQDTLIF